MKDFRILDITKKTAGGGPLPKLMAVEAQLEDENGEKSFLVLIEADGNPSFYSAKNSAVEGLLKGKVSADVKSLDLGDYDDILCNRDDECYLAYNHLVCIATFHKDASDRIIAASVGKKISEINIAAVL